jgi:hypothetical protein
MSNDGGPFRGQRERNVEYFDDIMGDNSPPALFEGSIDQSGGGMRNYDEAKSEVTAEGIEVQMHCRACPLENKILIPWSELFIVGHAPTSGLLPREWKKSDVNMAPYPETYCACRTLCAPIIPPDWAARKVEAALRAGLVSQQQLMSDPQVQALAQHLAQRQQRGG